MDSIFDARPQNFIARLGLKLLEALDLSNNLVRTTKALQGIPNGLIAGIIGVGAFFALIGISSLAYFFDVDATVQAMVPLRNQVAAATAGAASSALLVWLVQWVPVSLTLLPTVMEMLGSRFARFSIPAFQVITWFFVLFDLATDSVRVTQFMAPYWSAFVQGSDASGFFGILFTFDLRIIGGAIGFYVVWMLALLSASYFLELVAVLLLWSVVALLWKSVGYYGASILAGRKSRFRGDLGGEFDPDFRGDEVHSAEAAAFGHTARAPRPSAGAARGGPVRGRATPIYEDDFEDEDEDFEDDIDGIFGKGRPAAGARRAAGGARRI